LEVLFLQDKNRHAHRNERSHDLTCSVSTVELHRNAVAANLSVCLCWLLDFALKFLRDEACGWQWQEYSPFVT